MCSCKVHSHSVFHAHQRRRSKDSDLTLSSQAERPAERRARALLEAPGFLFPSLPNLTHSAASVKDAADETVSGPRWRDALRRVRSQRRGNEAPGFNPGNQDVRHTPAPVGAIEKGSSQWSAAEERAVRPCPRPATFPQSGNNYCPSTCSNQSIAASPSFCVISSTVRLWRMPLRSWASWPNFAASVSLLVKRS